MGELPCPLSPGGVRIRFDGCDGSCAVRWPRFSENEAKPFAVLHGILDALVGAAGVGSGERGCSVGHEGPDSSAAAAFWGSSSSERILLAMLPTTRRGPVRTRVGEGESHNLA